MNVLAIDPGCFDSAYAIIDATTFRPALVGKVPNGQLRALLARDDRFFVDHVAIEMVASYGMAVGAEVFETCVWVGRFAELAVVEPELVKRQPVKLHHCHVSNAKDSNIIQALVDRFAPGLPNRGKGTKAEPGFFYGFRADIWQAFALSVYVADKLAADGAEVPF